MTQRSRLALLAFGIAGIAALGTPYPTAAQEKGKVCDRGDYKCLGQYAAWNNWCRPACGDWNGYCTGQSLPVIVGRMAPQSFFADPWYYGQPQDGPAKHRAPLKPAAPKCSYAKRTD